MIRFELDALDTEIAVRVGTGRTTTAISRSAVNRFGPEDADARAHNDVQSAGAELAWLRLIGGTWEAENPPGSCDVPGPDGHAWHVRSTRYLNGWLGIRNHDRAAGTFVLIVGTLPIYFAVGTHHYPLTVEEADRYWTRNNPTTGLRLPYPCYAILQEDLAPLANYE